MKIKQFKDKIRKNLYRKYESLFLNRYKINGIEQASKDYFMRKLMLNGELAGFRLDVNEEITSEDMEVIGFGTYSANGYDWRGYPINVNILNEWNSPLIPTNDLELNKEVVLLRLNFIPKDFIDEYVERIVDIESTIRTNLKTQKMPFVIKSMNSKTLKAISDLLEDEEVIVLSDDNHLQVFNLNPAYIIDKLQQYKQDVESELLTLLNIDNVKFEKKAQMNVDEINSNNEEINAYAQLVEERIIQFFEDCNRLFNTNIELEETEEVESVKESVNNEPTDLE